ncbi:hypothetical protein LINPERHAP1_LOCUS2103 [Linum perenne]
MVTRAQSRDAQLGFAEPKKTLTNVGWGPGSGDWTIVNSDGSVITTTGRAAGGGLIRNSAGFCSKAFFANFGCCSITHAELRAAVTRLS